MIKMVVDKSGKNNARYYIRKIEMVGKDEARKLSAPSSTACPSILIQGL